MIDLEFFDFALPLIIPSDDGTYLRQFLNKEAILLNTLRLQNHNDDESASVNSVDSLKYYERRRHDIGHQQSNAGAFEQPHGN
jgi:hypothetical protein